MKTKLQIVNGANDLKAVIDANLQNYVTHRKDALLKDGITDEVVSEVFDAVKTIFCSYAEGIRLPEFIANCYIYDNDLKINIRSKLKADFYYKKSTFVAKNDDIIDNIASVFYSNLFELYYFEEAKKNLDEFNVIIAGIIAENQIPFSVKFTVDSESTAVITSITDKEIVFNASVNGALAVTDLGICQSGDEYHDYVRETAIKQFVESIKTIPTTAQLVKGNVKVIKEIVGVSTKKRTAKLIRGAYHKNARYISKMKSGFAYYNEKVTIDGAEVDVFALVEKEENGSIKVVLTPFDTATVCNVDYDVVKALDEFK